MLKKLFLILLLVIVFIGFSYADMYISTGTANLETVYSGACFVDGAYVTNISSWTALVYIYDSNTLKAKITAPRHEYTMANYKNVEHIPCITNLKMKIELYDINTGTKSDKIDDPGISIIVFYKKR